MKAVIDAKSLLKGLKKVLPAIKSNTVLPVLTSVKMDFSKNDVTVTATDLETTITVKCPAECQKPFCVVISYADIVKICENVSDYFTLAIEGNGIKITSDRSKYSIAVTHQGMDFPKVDAGEFTHEMEVDADFFWALNNANNFRSAETLRVNMNTACISIKKKFYDIVGTDANLMFRHTIKGVSKQEMNLLVSPTFVTAVKSFEKATMSSSDKFIQIQDGDMTVSGRLIDSVYVNYNVVIPQEITYNLKCDRKALIAAISSADVAASQSTHLCKLSFDKGKVSVSAQDVDFGKEGDCEISKVEHSVKIKEIGVNASMLKKMLDAIESEVVEMAFTEATKAVIIRPEGSPETLMLLMPMTLN